MKIPSWLRSTKNQEIELLKNEINKNQQDYLLAIETKNFDHQTEIKRIQNYNQTAYAFLKSDAENQENKYQWNKYTEYGEAVDYIYSASMMQEKWATLTGPIIEIRSALIGGNGIDVTQLSDEGERELAFINEWLKYNNLNNGRDLTLIEESEKEGRCCLQLIWNKDYIWSWTNSDGEEKKETGMVKVNFFPWYETKYTVVSDKLDKEKADKITWGKDKKLNSNEFSYRKFRGIINDLNTAVPKVWSALSDIDRFDEVEFDLWVINRLFASPVPVFSFQDSSDTRKAQESLVNYNWKVRKAVFLTNGTLSFVTPQNTQSVELLIKELKTHIQIISAKTQVPVQFLGFTEDVKNKNVSENLMEGVNASVQKDRQIYEDCFSESAIKSMLMWNSETSKTKLEPQRVTLKIGSITVADWNRLIKFFLPATEEGLISRETLWENTPGLDAKKEEQRATSILAKGFEEGINSNERNKTVDDEPKED
jgi:hypothetical protein